MYDLVIDARMQWHGGIGTYLQNLLPYLETSGLSVARIDQGPSIYSLKEQIKLPFLIPSCHIFWSPHFNISLLPIRAAQRLVTIHDFYHLSHLSQLTFLQRIYAKSVIRRAVEIAHTLIVGSVFTKTELYKFFPSFRGRVEMIHYGPGHVELVEESSQVPEPFFLFVGNLKPHKNLELLLSAFERLDTGHHLLIVGKKEGFIRGIDLGALSCPKRVHFLGSVTNAQLVYLYKRAIALVFPSLYEGWGFPPIEAMQAGCPVLAAHTASIPEVCANAALYFHPKDATGLLHQMKKIIQDLQLREALKQQGKERIKAFSWQECAKQHLVLIQKILNEQNRMS